MVLSDFICTFAKLIRKDMKVNTKNVMKSKWASEDMNTNWKLKDGSSSGMEVNHPLHSKNSRRTTNRVLKNKWRKEVKKQYNEEISEL